MQHSTIDQPGMEEILYNKVQELGRYHWQRMVLPGQEATDGPCNPEKNRVEQWSTWKLTQPTIVNQPSYTRKY